MGSCTSVSIDIQQKFNLTIKRKSKMSASHEVKKQLMVYHDPFSGATSQPKIPDGKCTKSLGFSTQAVTEISNRQSADNTLHMLLFPGMNAGLLARGAAQADLGFRVWYAPEFLQSGAVDWNHATATAGTDDLTFGQDDGYAKWRVVSTGVQLKLLNSVEEDDGWWEACRVNEPLEGSQWSMGTTNNAPSTAIETNGAILPINLLSQLRSRQIANDPTYMTGLLRDLHRIQFETHPVLDEHDFQVQMGQVTIEPEHYSYLASDVTGNFLNGDADVYNLIRNNVDFSHDMVYIRLHCRPNNGDTSLGSRFHVNVVSNQEIIYDTADRLARYQTRSHHIGDGNMAAHTNLRRGEGGAANMVM